MLRYGQAYAGLGRAVLRNRLARGRWQQPVRGIVVAHNGPITWTQRQWIAVLAAGDGALCAGPTAAALEGLRGYDSTAIHVLVPAQRRVVDAAAWARTDDDARAIVAAGFQQRRLTVDEIHQVLDVMPRSHRRMLVRATADASAAGAHAISELDFLALCRRAGLPVPDQQVPRCDTSGRRRFLDAYWRRWRLHVEIDGAWHLEVRAWWDDMRRQNTVWISGDRILRFPVWAIRHRPDEVVAQIRAALHSAGWRP